MTTDRARAEAHHRRTTSIRVGAVVGVALVCGGLVAAAHQHSATPSTPPGATRLVGAEGLVLLIPAAWSTGVEVGAYCPPDTPRTVQFFVSDPGGAIGSCAVEAGSSWPAEESLSVYTHLSGHAPHRTADGTVAGMPYYLFDDPGHQGPGVARDLSVPAARIRFLVGAATVHQADAILRTIRSAPTGTTTVALTMHRGADHPVLAVDPRHPLRSRIVEVVGGPSGEPPGELLRTDPPVGTPVPDGTMVTLELSAGDLDAYVAPASLRAAGWRVGPATTFNPPVTRAQAYAAVPDKRPRGGAPGNDGIYLRTLDGRLVWLVVLHQSRREFLRLTAVDAVSKAVVREHTFPLVHD